MHNANIFGLTLVHCYIWDYAEVIYMKDTKDTT